MKPISKLTFFVLTFPTLAATAFAEEPSPRVQFQTAVAAYQKTPTRETALKVIELYKRLDPLPAVPEEARRPFVMGATVLKKANDKAGAAKAVEFFTEAVRIAPWFTEAYYNRALAREITGQFTEAMDDLKLYLAFVVSDAEHREAQDKIYSLEADAQLVAAKKTEEDKIARSPEAVAAKRRIQDEALIKSLDGVRFDAPVIRNSAGTTWTTWYVINGKQLTQHVIYFNPAIGLDSPDNTYTLPITGAQALETGPHGSRIFEISPSRIVIKKNIDGETSEVFCPRR